MLDWRFLNLSNAALKTEIERLSSQRDTEEAAIVAVWKLLPGGGGNLPTDGDVDDVLTWNGTDWVAEPPSGGGGGNSFFSDSGAPGGGLGTNGDHYLNTANGVVYEKAAGTWTVVYTPPVGIVSQGDFADDADAATNGVLIGQYYCSSFPNDMGLPDGMLKKRTT